MKQPAVQQLPMQQSAMPQASVKPALPKHRLFVYGTLQLPERVHEIIGRTLEGIPAHLDGYRSGLVARADFPGIVPDAAARSTGQLLAGLTEAELILFDDYEGELYHRILVTAALDPVKSISGDHPITAWTYVIAPWAQARVTQQPWTIGWYRQLQQGRVTYRG